MLKTIQSFKHHFKYIARDKDSYLYLYEDEPILDLESGKYIVEGGDIQYIHENDYKKGVFHSITFENSPIKLKRLKGVE